MPHQQILQDWLEYAVIQAHPVLKTWYLPTQLEQNLREHTRPRAKVRRETYFPKTANASSTLIPYPSPNIRRREIGF